MSRRTSRIRHALHPHSHEAAAGTAAVEGARLTAALVHADPQPGDGADYHAALATHR